MSQPFKRTNYQQYGGYTFDKTEKYKYISSTDHIDINSGNQKLLLDGSNNKASIISENIDLSSTNILINAQEEVKIKAGTYTIDADTINQVYDNYEITVENVQRENNSLDWILTITGNSEDSPENLQIDNSNDVYITGKSTSNSITINQLILDNSDELVIDISYDVSLNGSSNKAFVIKYNSDGSLNWISTITGISDDIEQPVNLQIDNLNNVYITGYSYSNSITINQLILDNSYELVIDNSYDVSLNGNYYSDAFVIKYKPDGSLNWISTITSNSNGFPVNLQIDNLNNVYITGWTTSNSITINQLILDNSDELVIDNSYDVSLNGNYYDEFVIKYKPDGSLNWISTITSISDDKPVNLQIDNSNDVYITGYSNSNSITINQLILDNNNELVIVNSYDVSLNGSNNDAFVIKMKENIIILDDKSSFKIANESIELESKKITLDSSCASIVLDSSDCEVVIKADNLIDLSSQNINVLAQENITLDASGCASIVLDSSDCEVVIKADNLIDLSSQNINVFAQENITLEVKNTKININYVNYGNPTDISYAFPEMGGSFGQSVALNNAGNRLVVGDHNSNKAYIYNLDNSGNPTDISYAFPEMGGYFGYSVALNNAGDRLVVGTYSSNKVYIYNLDNSGNPTDISYAFTDMSGYFGRSVALNNAGNRLVVGAINSNKAYIYNLDNSGNPTDISYAFPNMGGYFGNSVALNNAGDRLVVGDYLSSKAYIYNLDKDIINNNINIVITDKISLDASRASIVLDSSDCEVVIKADNLIDLNSKLINYTYDTNYGNNSRILSKQSFVNLKPVNMCVSDLFTKKKKNKCWGHVSTYKAGTDLSAGRVVSLMDISNNQELKVIYVDHSGNESTASSYAIGVTMNDCSSGDEIDICTSGYVTVITDTSGNPNYGSLAYIDISSNDTGKVTFTNNDINIRNINKIGYIAYSGQVYDNSGILIYFNNGLEVY